MPRNIDRPPSADEMRAAGAHEGPKGRLSGVGPPPTADQMRAAGAAPGTTAGEIASVEPAPDRTVDQIVSQEPVTADELAPQADAEPAPNTRIGFWRRAYKEVIRSGRDTIKSTLSDPDFYINTAASTAINQGTKVTLLALGYAGWWAMPGIAAASAGVGYGRKQLSETNKAYLTLEGKEAEKAARLWQIKELKRRRDEIRASDNGEEIIKSINKKAVEGAAIAAVGSLVGGTIANTGLAEVVWGHIAEKSGWVADWFKNLNAPKPDLATATPTETSIPATATATATEIPATNTPTSVPATATATETAVPATATEIPSPTKTPEPPISTSTSTAIPSTSTPIPPTATSVPPTVIPTNIPDIPTPEPTPDPLLAELPNNISGGDQVALEPQDGALLNYKGTQLEAVLQQPGDKLPHEIKGQLNQWLADVRANGDVDKYKALLNASTEAQPTTFSEPLYASATAPAELAIDTPLGADFPSLKGYLEGVYADNLFETQFADQQTFNEYLINHGQDPNNQDWQKVWEGIAADKIPNTHDGKVLILRDMVMKDKGIDSKTYNDRVLALYNYVKTKTPESNFAARDSDFFDRSKGVLLPADMKKWWTDLEDIK